MVAGLSGELCDMLCCILKIGQKVRSWCLFRMEWWVTFEQRNRSTVPHFNGITIAGTMKGIKGIFLLQPNTNEATKNSILKDIHRLVYYFTQLNLNGKFNACSIWLKRILECRTGRNFERKVRILLFWKFVFECLLSCKAL